MTKTIAIALLQMIAKDVKDKFDEHFSYQSHRNHRIQHGQVDRGLRLEIRQSQPFEHGVLRNEYLLVATGKRVHYFSFVGRASKRRP